MRMALNINEHYFEAIKELENAVKYFGMALLLSIALGLVMPHAAAEPVPFNETLPAPPPPAAADNMYVLTASGPDHIGLVATLAEYLRQKNINIIDLATRRENDDYIMMFLVSLPPTIDVAKLQHSLKIAMEAVGLEVGLRHRALFLRANEI